MLIVEAPLRYENAKRYVLDTIFVDFLGQEIEIQFADVREYRIFFGDQVKEVRMPDLFFALADDWLSSGTVPTSEDIGWFDCRKLHCKPRVIDELIPVLFGSVKKYLFDDEYVYLPIDIVGTVFFFLTRYEEAVGLERDDHGRFPATASIAFKAGILDRPIVDEYVEVLWGCLCMIRPQMSRKVKQGRTIVTCDVDTPFQNHSYSLKASAKVVLGDILKRRSLAAAGRTTYQYLRLKRGDKGADPFYSAIPWIMDVNDRLNNEVSFYFIPEGSNPNYDMGYSLSDPRLEELLLLISKRGHSIGFHPSYESSLSRKRFMHEYRLLASKLDQLSISQQEIGGRQHYLRWNCGSPSMWQEAGLDYDSSLAFADYAGFRTGTSREYRMFDLYKHETLEVKQRALIAAESVIVSPVYMGMGHTNEALDYIMELKRRCLMFSGNFTVLWHNSSLDTPRDREFYVAMLTGCN